MNSNRKIYEDLYSKSIGKICRKCVMDESDNKILFNDKGICNHCLHFENDVKPLWEINNSNSRKLDLIYKRIRNSKKKSNYDCVLGLSGGVDSSYLAIKIFDAGLNPLVVHIDAGWNSEIAVHNIEKILNYCNFDLETFVVEWGDMRNLHLAYLQSGVANQDAPQDHAYFTFLYKTAVKHKIPFILSGGNIATEGVFPASWHHSAMDKDNIVDIYKKYSNIPFINYKFTSFFDLYFYYPFIKRLKVIRPLNFMNYNKKEAISELKNRVDWVEYGAKHSESLFTKLFQNYYLPKVHGYDKRRPHLSSLILSGQTSREEALKLLERPLYYADELRIDLDYFSKKLNITIQEVEEFMLIPPLKYDNYRNWDYKFQLMKFCQRLIEFIKNGKINYYS